MPKEKVELMIAYQWDCPECGRENFERAVVLEADEETIKEMKDEHGIEYWETGDFVTRPAEVVCKHCYGEFGTIDFSSTDDGGFYE